MKFTSNISVILLLKIPPNWVKNDTKSKASADPDLSSISTRSDLPRSPPAASRAPPAAAPAASRAIGPSIGSPT